jgi:hypothetical protein
MLAAPAFFLNGFPYSRFLNEIVFLGIPGIFTEAKSELFNAYD